MQAPPYEGVLTPAPGSVFMGFPNNFVNPPERIFMETCAGFFLTHFLTNPATERERTEDRTTYGPEYCHK